MLQRSRLVAEVIPSFNKYSWRIRYYFRLWVYKICGVPSWSTLSRGGDINIHKYLQLNMIWTTIVLSAELHSSEVIIPLGMWELWSWRLHKGSGIWAEFWKMVTFNQVVGKKKVANVNTERCERVWWAKKLEMEFISDDIAEKVSSEPSPGTNGWTFREMRWTKT